MFFFFLFVIGEEMGFLYFLWYMVPSNREFQMKQYLASSFDFVEIFSYVSGSMLKRIGEVYFFVLLTA